jgi:hypothetical protein
MGSGYFDAAQAIRTWAADAITNSWLLKVITDGAFVADAATRALFADDFVNGKKMLAIAFQYRYPSGGAAGDHTVTGIAVGDALLYVWKQDGTSGIITNLTSEFTITGPDTINNGGGTDTTGDNLIVHFLNKTA